MKKLKNTDRFQINVTKPLPSVVAFGGDVVLTVVVSSVVIPTGEVTTFTVVTLTLLGKVVFIWSLTGPLDVVETSVQDGEKYIVFRFPSMNPRSN